IALSTIRSSRAQSAPPAYTVIDLGTLPSGTDSAAMSLNNHGEVVGIAHWSSVTPTGVISVDHAFRWKDLNGNGVSDPGEMMDLGTLPIVPGLNGSSAPILSSAMGINDGGQVAGWSYTSRYRDPVPTLCAVSDDSSVCSTANRRGVAGSWVDVRRPIQRHDRHQR